MASLMFFSSTALSAYSCNRSSPLLYTAMTKQRRRQRSRSARIRAGADSDAGTEGAAAQAATEKAPTSAPPPRPKKPVYSMKKGQIVRVDKEKYLNSVNKMIVARSLSNKVKDPRLQALRLPNKEKKWSVVKVDHENAYGSYLSVGHPPYYKGLDYIYEDRGEVLDIRIFETGEYALIAWVGIPTAPAWLPTEMLIKSDRLDYERI